jgi:dipeptidyl aminopeptidase/acylaminoacyl peptidase
MSNGDNKGMQFVITTMIFIFVFLLFYFFFIKKDDVVEFDANDLKIAFINDGVLNLSDIKGENRVDSVHSSFVVWVTSGDGLYYIDNYLKLKHYDIESKKSEDIAINVASFEVSPTGSSIAFVEDDDDPSIKIVGVLDGELISEFQSSNSPRWLKDGDKLVYISGGNIYMAKVDGTGVKKVFNANAIDLDISPDGNFILFVEGDEKMSRLILGDIKKKSKKVIKEITFAEKPTESFPLGFSYPTFLNSKNEAFFILNEKKGGKIGMIKTEDESISGVSMENGPIFSLSTSTDDNHIAYFYLSKMNLPNYLEVSDEGEEGVAMEFTPKDLNNGINKKLLDMEEKKTLTGDKVNKNGITRILDSDRIKIVDLERGVFWFAGSGQYPSLR